ncbi:MAG: glycoside hydrolase family 9 protein [Verrucomicrobia bacterium]|nr:glycoside hydrolase family 9 protein [Verrucomicrobiota bacterium]
MKKSVVGILVCSCCVGPVRFEAAESVLSDAYSLSLPSPGSHQLRIVSPTVLELTRINSKAPDPARVDSWDFVDSQSQLQAPVPSDFVVSVAGQATGVQVVGFKRRPLYAPLRHRDLRIANQLYLELATPIAEGQAVEVRNPGANLWPADWEFKAKLDPLRFSPAIHINQVGYLPTYPKTAIVGYYLGSLGELKIPAATRFKLIDHKSGAAVFEGILTPRTDEGYEYSPKPYQNVGQADFSDFTTPGEYRLLVDGLGASWPFRIDEGVAMAFARTYALGLYHQRCGAANEMPFTRFTHGPCHRASVEVPDGTFSTAQQFVADASANFSIILRHTAARLKDFESSLYPFVNRGRVDVSGGHHDAGDYSKYTINSALLIHTLVFAADAFSGVAELDNLGIPESGDGISDLIQEAQWEADFLAKMQDADGGFYFLVYPRNRAYESDVLPDHGDPQIVWPKTTSVTAAAAAALAQCASSPAFQRSHPEAARTYLEKAKKGWEFLANALAKYGKDGSYQKLISYGNEFMHDDELAWAACELFLATGDQSYHDQLKRWFDPDDPNTWRWTWWRLFDAYGNAVRSYAFASRTGRRLASELDSTFLSKCQRQIRLAGEDALARSRQNAYGTSFPIETKRIRTAGWYFSTDQAFDIAVASQLEPNAQMVRGFLYNLNYEGGCNPVNVCYVTGLGLKRQREMVHQYALNDRRRLPPSGLPLGNIQDQFPFLDLYAGDLGKLTFPSDGAATAPYPFYDRWADSFNVMTEFTIINQARSLAATALLAAQTSLKNQAWRPTPARITGLSAESGINVPVTARVEAAGMNLDQANVVWEARNQEPAFGNAFTLVPASQGTHWIEVEAQWPDGRRMFGTFELFATNTLPTVSVTAHDAAASETGPDPGGFTFARAGSTDSALTVKYSLAGSAIKWDDYRTLEGDVPESVTIPAGSNAAKISLYAVDDLIYEGAETVRISLLSDSAYNVGTAEAEFRIQDNDPPVQIPSIITHPQGQSVTTGSDVLFRVAASGTVPLSFQWRFNGQDIPGATSEELRLSNVQPHQAGQYYAVVRNTGGAVDSGSATLTVFVPPVVPRSNTVPNIAGLSNREVTADVASVFMNFSLTDAETPADQLNVTIHSSNAGLLPDSNIAVGGAGAHRTLSLAPVPEAVGSTMVTVAVSDGRATASQSFLLTVTPRSVPLGSPPPNDPPPPSQLPPPVQLQPAQPPVIQEPPAQPSPIVVQPPPENSAPTIASIPDQSTDENTPTFPIEISIADRESSLKELDVTAESSNKRLVPVENILFSNGGAARRLVLVPTSGESGTAEITIAVSDGEKTASTRFLLTVRTVNHAPVSAPLAFTVMEDTPLAVALAGEDADGDPLVYTVVTWPTKGILSGDGARRTYTPLPQQTGSDQFTYKVSDPALDSAPATVTLNIVHQNLAPSLSFLDDRKVRKNRSTFPIQFKVADAETAADLLVVSAISDNPTLLPDSSFALSGSGAERTLVITPAKDQTGQARIMLSVTDSEHQASMISFQLRVEDTPAIQSDFNGDGLPDIIFQDADGFLAAWLMNREHMKSVEFLLPSSVGDQDFRIAGSGDFNADGQQDLLFQHKDGGLALWYMDGLTQIGVAAFDPMIPVDAKWRVASTGDLNRDGQIDLVLQHSNGSLAVSYLNGTSQLSSEVMEPSATGDPNWRVVGTGDLNADGNVDLALQFSDGALVIWYLEGKKLIGVAPTDPPETGDAEWRLVGMTDWNADGHTDFLFQHRTDGTLAVWYLKGTRLTRTEFLTPDRPGGTWRVAAP